jgi:hypothetical protein
MTEVPEHLLRRSRERRAAIGGGDAGGETPSAEAPESATPAVSEEAAAPAAAAAATPARVEPAPPPEPEPVRPEVEAYQRRRKIPYWAMPVLAALPLWAYVYQGTLEPPPAGEDDPLVLGEEVYGSCASCHLASGAGSSAVPALTDVLETWPDYRDQMMWVRLGSTGWPTDTYGATDKEKQGGMPEHPALSDEELAQVVLYERTQFGEEDPADQEELLAVAEGEMTFEEVELGPEAEEAGVDPAELAAG